MLTKKNIIERRIKIAVIGLGYVGLPLAVEFAKNGFNVIGIDFDEDKIKKINKGKNYIQDVCDKELASAVAEGLLCADNKYDTVKNADVCVICVPTPLNKTWEPDMSYVISASENIAKNMSKGTLVILESTTYPGTTDELILPILETDNRKSGKDDFYLAFSPERVDPGNEKYTTKTIPKIVGGINKKSTELAQALYSQVVSAVIPVSCSKVAETAKLLENTFRTVNIGLINEIALMCDQMGIDVWEVIDAASTKPFGFMPFYPGPGLGGHCLPIDPLYLAWKARFHDFDTRFITLASEVNRYMPHFVVKKVTNALNLQKKAVNGSKILILGVAYKNDIDDVRESPALTVIELLKEKGADLSYSDPYIKKLNLEGICLESCDINEKELKSFDCAIIITAHKVFDYQMIVDYSNIIIDTRNALKNIVNGKEKVIKL